MRDGWTETTLGDVADVIDPHPSHRAPPEHDGGVPFIGIGDVRDGGRTDFGRARKVSPSVLVEHALRYDRKQNLIGLGRVASIGLVVRLPTGGIDYAVSPTLAVLHPREMDNDFLFYYLQADSLQEQLQTYKRGSTRQSVGMLTLRQLKVFVPPLDEQKRIVDVVSSVDTYIDALQQRADTARTARNAVLHELSSAGGDDWTTTTLGDISNFVSKRELPKDLALDTPYVGLEHVDPKTTLISTWGDAESVSSSVTPFEPEDTLFGRLRPYLHKVAFADFPGVCSPEILVLRSNAKCESKFLYLLCSLESTVKECVDMSAGTRMPRTSTTDLASIEIQLPPPAEQKQIVEVVSSMDEVIQATEQAITEAKNLRSGLLSDLLSGNHEIPASYDSLLGAA